ncbi:hypothetical protein PybrP1_008724 [[Pythium] brassicae (nom. inval.)]|nr:hypothetical protein PybrP1_008724 [[Pythium] brassicae (nom. inval.)]
MVVSRSLAIGALAATCAFVDLRAVEAVKACGECAGTTTCIVEDTGTRLAAGTAQLALRLCNYNAAAAPQLEFRLKTQLPCDPRGALVPKLKALKPSAACPAAGECAVVAELESAIDWAVAMRSGAELNAVLATFKSGGSAEVVTVAQSAEVNGAAMPASTGAAAKISLCAGAVEVKALRLSQVDGCSTADVCRGKATDTACVVPVKQGLPITGVTCDKEFCSGRLALAGSLSCDAAQGDAAALIVAVKAGASALSNYASIGTLAAPTSAITDVSDLAAGSATFKLSTNNSHCPTSAVQVTVAKAGGGAVAASVANVNVTNGSVAVTLSAPLEASLDGAKLAITLSQCSVASAPFESLVGADDDSSDAGVGHGSSSNSSHGPVVRTSGIDSTQEKNVDTGLSGGMYVGIAVAVVALFGFVFEFWFHKRRQSQPPRSNSDAPVASGYAHSSSL